MCHMPARLTCRDPVINVCITSCAAQVLGKGGFGQVVQVVKRDCGLAYAMKIQQKPELEAAFGDDWEMLALTEMKLLAALRHPLLVNLAYAFQTIDQLALVMDACPHGDLSRFGAPKEDNVHTTRLDKEAVRFVAIEACCVVKYLAEGPSKKVVVDYVQSQE